MEKNVSLSIKVIDDDCMCNQCHFCCGIPGASYCMKYRVKPSEILYEDAKCPKFLREPMLDENIDEDDD